MNAKKEASHRTDDKSQKEAMRVRDGLPFPEPGTERELLHNRRYVRKHFGSFRKKSWFVNASLPLIFAIGGSAAAIAHLSKNSDGLSALGTWSGAEGIVAIFSYLSMMAMFRGNKTPKTYLVIIGLATLGAVAVNVLVTPDLKHAVPLAVMAAFAPIATAGAFSAMFRILKSCLDDASNTEFFDLHQKETKDLKRIQQLARTPEEVEAQDEALEIGLRHTSSDRVTSIMANQVDGIIGVLPGTPMAPALETAPVVDVEVEDDVEDEPEEVVPMRLVDSRQPIIRKETDRLAVLPESGGMSKGGVSITLPKDEIPVEHTLTPVQKARRELARLYWLTTLNDRHMRDAEFGRQFIVHLHRRLDEESLKNLDREGRWVENGSIPSSYLSRVKAPTKDSLPEDYGVKYFPASYFVAEHPELAEQAHTTG